MRWLTSVGNSTGQPDGHAAAGRHARQQRDGHARHAGTQLRHTRAR